VYEKRPDLAASPALPAATADTTKTAQPAQPAAIPTAPAPAVSDETIKNKVLAIVAEKTGYPTEMLDLDLDLEADLGIDTVKQAEMFASVRAAFNIPRDAELKLRDFPTLAHVIRFAHDRATPASAKSSITKSEPGAAERSAVPVPAGPPKLAVARPAPASFDAANRVPRRVPVPILRPTLAMCKPSGVTLGSGRRVLIMPDKGGVGDELSQQLMASGVEVLRIEGNPSTEVLETRIEAWLAGGPIHGVYWLPALDDEGDLKNLDGTAWREAIRIRVKLLYVTMRKLFDQVGAPGTSFVSATRLGGQHGYDEGGASAPLGGAVTGFTKTFKRERLEAQVKAVDFESEYGAAEIARVLVEETLRDPGAVEVGYKQGLRWAVGLREQSAADGARGLTLDRNTVFLITGAAGSIVSAITADLAMASGGIFYLLDLVPQPDRNNPDLKRFAIDREGLKRDLFARIQARGERATPALVEKELAALERAQAAASAIEAVEAAGGTAKYFSVNLTDGDAVAKVVEQIRQTHGRIDVLLHAAGMERSHRLPEKTPQEFDLVFDVKSDGWFHLLHAIGDMPLGATVAFSSIAGRFGNPGQTDYSAANDLLCKITSSFRRTRPATRGIVIDWTAWGSIGMASRGSIPKVMEAAGIDMLPPEAGIPVIRRELTTGGTRGEILIGQRLGVLLNEWDASGGLDPSFVAQSREGSTTGPMTGKISGLSLHEGFTTEIALDPTLQPFLHDHQIDGTPVLPGVMGIEGFAETASHLVSGWKVEAVEDVNFLAPFKFYRNETRTLTMKAAVSPCGDSLLADCRLIGQRLLPNQKEPQVQTHFTARVRLTKHEPRTITAVAWEKPTGHAIEPGDIYRLYFHGPAYRVVERAWWDGKRMIGQMARSLPANHVPTQLSTVMEPRLIELCFQTAGLWEMGVQSRMGLPHHVDRVTLLCAPGAGQDIYAIVTPHADQQSFDADVVDTQGRCHLRLTSYRTVTVPTAIEADRLKALQSAMSGEAVLAA
jgi:NAD(P)-dependent dehydrogenase (short-subunit alcohol dehydrogenase family)